MLFTSTSNIYANGEKTTEIVSVIPSTIKMRHAQDINIDIKNWQPNTQISITPGGAYIKSQIEIDPIQTVFTNSGFIWIQENNQLNIYNKDLLLVKSHKLQNNIQQFSIREKILITSTQKHLEIFQIDENLNIHKKTTKIFQSLNLKTSLAKKHACLLINNNQIFQLNLESGEIFQSPIQNKIIEKIQSSNTSCVSISKHNQITLWGKNKEELVVKSSYRSNNEINEAVVKNNHIILANGNNGFTILTINNNSLQWLGSYNKLGNITHASNHDQQLLVSDDRGVISLFNINNPQNPLLIADFHSHNHIIELNFKNNIAYVVTQKNLLKVDFSSKSTPIISTLGVNQGGSRRSFIKDNILYVADWFSGMHLYDISIPHAPRLLSSFQTPGSPKGVVVRKNTAFIADDDHGLQVIDVSDPHNPEFITELPLSGLAYTMKLIDDLLYIAAHRGGFHIVDVSNHKQPKLLSTYDTPSKAWALEYQSGLLYVADDSSGLMIFDVTKPETPKLINQFNPGGFAEDVLVRDNKAYIAFFDLGLMILDISNPFNLKVLSQLPTPGNARGIDIKNNLLYLASWEAGVLIIDISNDLQPRVIGHYDTKGATWGLSVDKHNLYAMDWWGGIKILDISNSQQPKFLAQYQTAGKIKDIVYHNNFIYTAHGSRGLQVYDANNSLNPVWATGLDFDGDARNVTLINKIALVAAGDGGLVVADVSNPFQIKWLSQLAIPTSADLVQAIKDMAFIATTDGDLYVVDISTPTQPKMIRRYTSKTQSIQLADGILHHLDNNRTVKKYFVNKLTGDIKTDHFKIDSNMHVMAINNRHLYLANINGEINHYDLDSKKPQASKNIKLPEYIIALYSDKVSLYVTTQSNKLYVFNIKNSDSFKLQSIYPTTHKIEQISASNDGIFFSGENTIASAKLLPRVSIEQNNNSYVARIPKNMPLGAYNLNISTASGQQKTYINAFEVAFPKLKSKFSMEDLKRKMNQKNLPGKADSQL